MLGMQARMVYHVREKMICMETKEILLKLRQDRGLSQDDVAARAYVTRQAVSRWENGETIPNTETLRLLSRLYDVSINTLLGEPRRLICQCCGMPLEDAVISRETDGSFNERYCKWCYTDGRYVYADMQTLIDFLSHHMANESWPAEQVRADLEAQLPKLDHWKQK